MTSMLTTVGPRLLPGPPASVPQALLERGVPLGPLRLDHAFTVPEGGTATLTSESGEGVAISWGQGLRWLQVFTSDWAPLPGARSAVAIEPMSCPPDAFNSGVDVLWLSSEVVTVTCTIAAIHPV
ncbi:hypothetical protein [Ornithinimicrobium panacihumi]|uniref:hypothetical protein n=1 Tax=Ornithinimicrobium panacihumi TaxID=2008449 RepID=UPI003F8C674F